MLNSDKVLDYVKDNLGFPFQKLEYDDDKLLDYIVKYPLTEFSKYIPDYTRIPLLLTDTDIKVPDRLNEFYINDPEGLEILGVKEIYASKDNAIILGHPLIGPLNQFDLRQWVLDVEVSQMVRQFSDYNYTFKFKHPNIIRISPIPTNVEFFVVEYERIHSPDFSTIPNEYQIVFEELALSEIMMLIGRIRKRYGSNLKTPWGDIPLNGDEIFTEGQDKKREIIDKLTNLTLPSVIINFG